MFDIFDAIIYVSIAGLIGYVIGWLKNLNDIRLAFPDLYEEIKRRCKDEQ